MTSSGPLVWGLTCRSSRGNRLTFRRTARLPTEERDPPALLTQLGLPDVDQHVGVGAVPDGQVIVVAPVVVLDRFLFRTPGHHVIVEFTPLERRAKGHQQPGRRSEMHTNQKAAPALGPRWAGQAPPPLPSSLCSGGTASSHALRSCNLHKQPIFNLGSIY